MKEFDDAAMRWISEATSLIVALSVRTGMNDAGAEMLASTCSECWDAFEKSGDTNHDAAPAARAAVTSCAGGGCTGGTPQTDAAAEPVAWATLQDDGDIAWIGYTPDGAADGACGRKVVPLYRSPPDWEFLNGEIARRRLTDAEREAISVAAVAYSNDHGAGFAKLLRGLLERLK
jgi:hypothetical protein